MLDKPRKREIETSLDVILELQHLPMDKNYEMILHFFFKFIFYLPNVSFYYFRDDVVII